MNGDVKSDEDKRINYIKKFLLMNYYLTTFNIKKFKEYTKGITSDCFYILYFIFNVFIISAFNSAVPQLIGDNASKEVRILIGNYEKNNFEYFVSFIIGYLVLFFVVRFLWDKVSNNLENKNEIILKAILCVSGSFILIKIIGNVARTAIDFSFYSSDYPLDITAFWYTLLLYLLWLWFIYALLDFESKKDKLLTMFGVVICLLLNLGSVLYFTSFQSRLEVYHIAELLKDVKRTENILIRRCSKYRNLDEVVALSRKKQVSSTTIDAQNDVFEIEDDINVYDYLIGAAIVDMSYASYELYCIEELSYRERYRHMLLYILGNMFLECNKKDEIIDAICRVIEGNYVFASRVVKKYETVFRNDIFVYLTPNEIERCLAVLHEMNDLREKYRKEILSYNVYTAMINEYKFALYNCPVEFRNKDIDKFNELYFVTKLIRFLPVY